MAVRFPIRRGLLARVQSQVHAVAGVSLTMARGETLGLAGESGCGKTTLGRVLAGLEPPTSGAVKLAGQVLFCAGPPPRTAQRPAAAHPDGFSGSAGGAESAPDHL